VLAGRLDLLDVIEVTGNLLGALVLAVEENTTSSATSSRAAMTPDFSGNITPLRKVTSRRNGSCHFQLSASSPRIASDGIQASA